MPESHFSLHYPHGPLNKCENWREPLLQEAEVASVSHTESCYRNSASKIMVSTTWAATTQGDIPPFSQALVNARKQKLCVASVSSMHSQQKSVLGHGGHGEQLSPEKVPKRGSLPAVAGGCYSTCCAWFGRYICYFRIIVTVYMHGSWGQPRKGAKEDLVRHKRSYRQALSESEVAKVHPGRVAWDGMCQHELDMVAYDEPSVLPLSCSYGRHG